MKRTLWIAVRLVALASLACSLGGLGGGTTEESAPPQATSGEAPTQPPEGGESGEVPPPEVASDALEGLDSYRGRIVWQWTSEEGTPEYMEMEIEETRDPPAKRYVINAEGESMEWIQIGDTTWICSDGSCIQSQQNEEMTAAFGQGPMIFGLENASEFLEGTEYEYLGQETVNGVRTRHYILTPSPMMLMPLTAGEVDDIHSEVWIANESGLPAYMARFTFSWKGTHEGEAGSGEYTFDIYDVNVDITIEPPEEAGSGLPEDIPLYPNATNVVTMEAMATFTSPDDPATVADFYRTELATLGWNPETDESMGGIIMQTWTKEGRQLTLTISPMEEGCSVLIGEE